MKIDSTNYKYTGTQARTVNFGTIIRNDMLPKSIGSAPRIFVVSGPSGVGKDSIMNGVKDLFTKIVTCTTRQARPGEINGESYNFLSLKDFKKGIKDNDFVEYVNIYGDKFYGTRRKDIDKALLLGKDVALLIETEGAKAIKKEYPDAIGIFIRPSSLEILRKRLLGRGTEAALDIERRLKKSETELLCEKNYDVVIQNDELNESIKDMRKILS